jgi:hypothetical protein
MGTRLRGLGHHHRQVRRRWKQVVDQGKCLCWRCGRLIEPGTPWDLGHVDGSRTQYAGPEHAKCNRGAPRRVIVQRRSRIW